MRLLKKIRSYYSAASLLLCGFDFGFGFLLLFRFRLFLFELVFGLSVFAGPLSPVLFLGALLLGAAFGVPSPF
ncbi:hypothetical protein JCM19274_4118 [Algibacter lectus]|uniref:Uncharacterized protein n=1 Tax=Algibacter lectus TaxID=221126 RepID=A0A090WS58_9FLAO|nr:hypothetical protein JCM19274_4118 [Algibacter lectus]